MTRTSIFYGVFRLEVYYFKVQTEFYFGNRRKLTYSTRKIGGGVVIFKLVRSICKLRVIFIIFFWRLSNIPGVFLVYKLKVFQIFRVYFSKSRLNPGVIMEWSASCIEQNSGVIMEWSTSCNYQNYVLISVSKNCGVIFT